MTLGGLINPAGASFRAGGLGGATGDAGLQRRRQRVYQQRRRFRADLRRAAEPRRLASPTRGTFGVHNNTALTISGGFTNSGTLDVDNAVTAFAGAITYAEGGSSLTIGGTLDNTKAVQVGSVVV